jgi:hypothetical protein
MIFARAQRMLVSRAGLVMTEASGSHAIYVSNPEVIAEVSKQARLDGCLEDLPEDWNLQRAQLLGQ